MNLIGPDSFELAFDSTSYRLCEGRHPNKFSERARSNVPKLYVLSSEGNVIYVGVTKQPIGSRLNMGWRAKGESGYYGYAWRHVLSSATIHVWYHADATERSIREVETVEAEVAFLVRSAGQWPAHQTEIHFYPSNEIHRAHAKRIMEFIATAS